jgi:signal transduction histidine kinase
VQKEVTFAPHATITETTIILGGGGRVLAASGQVPADVLNRRLDECLALPASLREAGRAMLKALRRSPCRVLMYVEPPDETGHGFRLITIDAIPLRRHATDIRSLLNSKLDVLRSQAEAAGFTLSVVFDANTPDRLSLDAEKLAWAVTALVGNALRYAQTGSHHLRGRTIEVRALCPGGAQLVIEVRDDGPGVSADTVARLFRRDGLNVRGSGLALLLLDDIMSAHAGTIAVESSTDPASHGTTVRLTFPLD